MERHCAGSNISISAQSRSNISAPVLSHVNVTGDISITNYFAEAAAEITDTVSLITEHKTSVLSEFAYLTEYTSRAGEQVLLNERYVEPMIVHKHREKDEKEKEMRSRGEQFFNFRTNQKNQNISLDLLFSPENRDTKNVPRAIILQGDSGSGKSITAQKIFHSWASGDLYAGLFDAVFYLRCQELSGLSSKVSLVDILNCSLTPNEIAQILKDRPQRTLFIVDGFDELVVSAPIESLPPKPDIKAHPSSVLYSLLKGRMMRDSYLLVTTRSSAVDKLEGVLKKPQRFMEILGFSEKGVIEYFQKFFEDEEFSKQVYEQVKVHEMLYTVCFIPVFCWIICTIFKNKGKDGVVTSELTTTTSVFVDFVFTILKHHSNLGQKEEFDLLKSLGQLAESGMPKRQILFHKNNLPKAISDVPNVPFLCTLRQQKRTFLKEMVGFMHLSFQEFFSALSYMLTDKSEAKIKVKELLEAAGNGRRSDHLLPVIRFLFGLSNKKVSRLFTGEQQRSTSSIIRGQLEKWISKVIVKNIMDMFYMSDFILHCLYEIHDRDILKNVMRCWERSGIHIHWTLKGIDCQVFMYCLQYSKHISRMELRCSGTNLKALHFALCRCNTLWLEFNSMSDTDVDFLISALGRKKTINLTMEDGDLSDESLRKILKTLREQQSVENIRVSLRSISYTNADITMNFLMKEMMGKTFSICIASHADSREESLCSEFTMESKNNSFWLTVGHAEEDQAAILEKDGVRYYQAFSKLSFAVSTFSAIATVDWKDFLKVCHNLRHFSDVKDAEFGENVDLLLSFLNSVPDLIELDIRAENLTDIWTSRIVSYLQVNPKIPHITFHVSFLIISDVKKVCSTFSVSRKPFVQYKMHDSERHNPCLTLAVDRWAYDVGCWSSGDADRLHPQDKPALVKLILSFPPLEESRIVWEELFKKIYQLIQLTEESSELEERVDSLLGFLHAVPALMEVRLWLDSLNEMWAAGLLSLFFSCSSLLYLQLKTSMSVLSDVESLGVMRENGVKLSVGCNHLNYIENFDISLFEPPVHKVIPCMTIMLTDESENRNTDWKRFFHVYNQLKIFTEYCPEYEKSLCDLLSVLHSASGLKDLELVLRFTTVDGASRVLDLLHTNSSLRTLTFLALRKPDTTEMDFRGTFGNKLFSFKSETEEDSDSDRLNGFGFQAAGQVDSDRESLSSSLSDCSDETRDCDELDNTQHLCSSEIMSEILCSDLRVHRRTSGSSNTSKKWRIDLKSTGSSLNTQLPLSYITLTLSESSGQTSTDWRSFIWAYNQCKGISVGSSRFDERVDGLLLSLHSLAGLMEIHMMTDSLMENWAPKILSLCYTCSSLHKICLQVEYDRRGSDLNVCSSLNLTRNISDSTVTVDICAAHNSKIRTIPSFISITSPCSAILKLDGHKLLQTLDLLKGLKEDCSEHQEYVSDLMSILLSVPDLRRVKLNIGNLTENWVRRIRSLSDVCSGLQQIRCDCTEDDALVLEDHVELLQSSQMNSDCRIIITGVKCSEGSDITSRTSASGEKVRHIFCRNSLSTDVLTDEHESQEEI